MQTCRGLLDTATSKRVLKQHYTIKTLKQNTDIIVVLCRDRFLAGRNKLRLGSKNRDGSRRDSTQRKT